MLVCEDEMEIDPVIDFLVGGKTRSGLIYSFVVDDKAVVEAILKRPNGVGRIHIESRVKAVALPILVSKWNIDGSC